MADTTNAQKYKGYDLDRNSSHRRRKINHGSGKF